MSCYAPWDVWTRNCPTRSGTLPKVSPNGSPPGSPDSGSTRLQNAVAGAIKAKRDRIPVLAMGTGSLSSGTPIRDVMFGAEFGGQGRPRTQQFPPHNGNLGYFLYPTVRELGPKAAEDWFDAVADAVEAHWHN